MDKEENSTPKSNGKKIAIITTIAIVVILAVSIAGASYFSKTFFPKKNSASPSNSPSATSSTTSSPKTTSTAKPELQLEDYNGGFFSIKKPVGWTVTTGGTCSTFAFLIQNPNNSAEMIFYFGEIGPVYLSENQKKIDENYMNMGGYKILWYEMPVIDPLTPENFLKSMNQITSTDLTKQFMSAFPDLSEVEIISSNDTKSIVPGTTKLIRAVFKEHDTSANGLFFLTTTALLPENGMPSAGIGYGMTFAGISAGRSEFPAMEAKLNESLNSLNISEDYVSNCISQQNAQAKATLKAGQTLSETSDIIMEGWEARNKSDDIISEKRSDVMLGRDRVYSPDTNEVYDVENGWYDSYNTNREKFNMDNLQQLPNDSWQLWTSPTKNSNEIE